MLIILTLKFLPWLSLTNTMSRSPMRNITNIENIARKVPNDRESKRQRKTEVSETHHTLDYDCYNNMFVFFLSVCLPFFL